MIQWEHGTRVLATWAALATLRSRPLANWYAVEGMIGAAGPLLALEAERLGVLLTESRKRLAPLEDPFDLDLGLHRWLDGEREEAYSDWLAWVVGQAKTPERVFRLLGMGLPPDELLETQHASAQRECCVPHGHIDQTGRLDLVIRFGHQAIIVVEVKRGDAESADTVKQRGYSRWFEAQQFRHKYAIFLAVSAQEEMYEGFTFLSWQGVCVEMRRLAMEIGKERRIMAAAMVLAFVAAVEQNLLGFSADLVRRICAGRTSFFNAQVVDHLELFLKTSGA